MEDFPSGDDHHCPGERVGPAMPWSPATGVNLPRIAAIVCTATGCFHLKGLAEIK